MAGAYLSRRTERAVGYPPLLELGELQRREFHEALLEANSFEDLFGSGRRRS
jgi:broad specificity phosphatase PhoE